MPVDLCKHAWSGGDWGKRTGVRAVVDKIPRVQALDHSPIVSSSKYRQKRVRVQSLCLLPPNIRDGDSLLTEVGPSITTGWTLPSTVGWKKHSFDHCCWDNLMIAPGTVQARNYPNESSLNCFVKIDATCGPTYVVNKVIVTALKQLSMLLHWWILCIFFKRCVLLLGRRSVVAKSNTVF